MSFVLGRVLTFLLLFILSLLPALAVDAQVVHAVPIPGDQFVIHYEQVSSGTYTIEGASDGRFHTTLTGDFTALVVRSVTQTHGWEASYRYDYLRIESQVDEATPTLLEVWPARMSIDRKDVYNARLHPDTPPPLLVQVLIGGFRARVGNQGDLIRIEECEKYHELLPFLDLTQPFHDTWMHRPPEPLSVGKKWLEDRPFRLWPGRLTIPASQTYEVKTMPTGPNRTVSLSLSRTLQTTHPWRIPIPLGGQVLPVLRFDALGPDINAPPPDLKITSLTANTNGTMEYRLDRGFLTSKRTREGIRIQMEVPPVDGTMMTRKRLWMDRATSITVTYHPAEKFSEEARLILFGR